MHGGRDSQSPSLNSGRGFRSIFTPRDARASRSRSAGDIETARTCSHGGRKTLETFSTRTVSHYAYVKIGKAD
ncbi:hypothetical protein ElyMa_005892400 [Elysia marginata]|uniref:Uncharacterized protein n=1 Tax=Elysia marginata TaxID=1093978 RepID=A0AAV4G4D9_9GAST|nr:hypothetical protein ElyMa_005892400 [Elysia marginata]